MSETVAGLIDSGLIVKTSTVRRSGRNGRPGTGITLNPQAGMYVGLDFGFRHVRGVLADVSHTILATRETLIGLDYSTEMGLAAAEELVDELLREGGVTPGRVLGIGVAIPGPVDPDTGKVMGTSMIPTWAGVDIAAQLGAVFGSAVLVDNESNCAALSEHLWGAGVGYSNLAYVKLHSGVGGAIVLNGTLVHGLAGAAGEFGHITIDDSGPLCRCGGRGCLEAYVGIPALLSRPPTDARRDHVHPVLGARGRRGSAITPCAHRRRRSCGADGRSRLERLRTRQGDRRRRTCRGRRGTARAASSILRKAVDSHETRPRSGADDRDRRRQPRTTRTPLVPLRSS